MIYKYTIEAYNSSAMGKLDVVSIVVYAADDDTAIKRASTIRDRTDYDIESIEDLPTNTELRKG